MNKSNILGTALEVTNFIKMPPLFDRFGAGTKVYDTYIYMDTHSVRIEDSNPSYELYHIGTLIVPEKSNLSEDDSEYLNELEINIGSIIEPVTYIYCYDAPKSVKLFEADQIKDDQSYSVWYEQEIKDAIEWALGNSGPDKIVFELTRAAV